MTTDEKEGRFMMRDYLLTGNKGHCDSRNRGSKNLRRDLYLSGNTLMKPSGIRSFLYGFIS